jgi:hypothetical protein
MAAYRTEGGEETTGDNPHRLLWYGSCGYWTDDWEKVRSTDTSGIPNCPVCHAVGYQIRAHEWFRSAEKFERQGHVHYEEFIRAVKEQCGGGVLLMDRYSDYCMTREPGVG